MNRKEQVPAVLCLPDMNGYTRFMSQNNPDYCNTVIPALLESIIASNILNFQVAEVEGDAILFYRIKDIPGFSEMLNQCQMIYENFGSVLNQLDEDCGNSPAGIQSHQLGLKMVIHFGYITLTEIGQVVKPLGEDIVIVHKLLKNSIPESEYILFTENYLSNQPEKKYKSHLKGQKLLDREDEYEHLGCIKYRYMNLRSSLTQTLS